MLYFVWKMKCCKNVISKDYLKHVHFTITCATHIKKKTNFVCQFVWVWNLVLRRCLGLKRDEAISLEENAQWSESFYTVTKHYVSYIKREEIDGARDI